MGRSVSGAWKDGCGPITIEIGAGAGGRSPVGPTSAGAMSRSRGGSGESSIVVAAKDGAVSRVGPTYPTRPVCAAYQSAPDGSLVRFRGSDFSVGNSTDSAPSAVAGSNRVRRFAENSATQISPWGVVVMPKGF